MLFAVFLVGLTELLIFASVRMIGSFYLSVSSRFYVIPRVDGEETLLAFS